MTISFENERKMPRLFKTDVLVLGIGPYCIEFPDGEIITTRSQERQYLIAAAEELLQFIKQNTTIMSLIIDMRAAFARDEGK